MALAAAILCSAILTAILGVELCRRLCDKVMHKTVAIEVGRYVDDMYFLTWDDIQRWYASVAETVFGCSDASLDPLEASTILRLVEERIDLTNEAQARKKTAIIENARESLPTTFDCYRTYGSGRAMIAAIAAGVFAFEIRKGDVSAITSTVVVIVLSIVLLTTIPPAIFAALTLVRAMGRPRDS